MFGPLTRSYKQHTPKKMRRLAIRCLLSEKAATGHLIILDGLSMDRPSTKGLISILEKISAGSSTLIALEEMEQSAHRSARNLPKVRVAPAALLNVLDLMNYDHLVVSVQAIRHIEALWAEERPRLPMRRNAIVATAQGGE